MTKNSPTRATRLARAAVLTLAVICSLASSVRAQDFDRYYQVRMSGSPAGWMRSTQKADNDRITTTGEMTLKIKRGPINLDITMSSEFVETSGGQPISMRLVQKMGPTPITTNYVFGPSELTSTVEQAGRVSTVTKPLPKGVWLSPAAAGRANREKMAAGEKTFDLRVIDPMAGPDPMTVTRKVVGLEKITIKGKVVEATRTTVDASSIPGIPTVEFLDSEGLSVRSDTTMGGLEMSLILAGPDVVTATIGEAPEMMVSTFVRPSRPIERARDTREAVYIVTNPNGPIPELPSTGFQSVEAIDEHSARVILDLGAPVPAPADDANNADFTGSSALIDADDEQVKKLTARALTRLRAAADGRNAADQNRPNDQGGPAVAAESAPMERAEAIRKAVFRHIKKKSLGVGFASASETVRSREGDCSEHGVLLAAALRADGIPARVVAGLVYVDQFSEASAIFGYHMWAQALIEVDGKPRWIDLDATLSEQRSFDATHLTISTSSLADDQPQNSLAKLASTLGSLQIKVESTR